MATFAQVDGQGVVVQVIEVDDGDAVDEPSGQAFIASLGIAGDWVQCSQSGGFRGTYPGPGMVYDSTAECFAPTFEEVPQVLVRAELAAAALGAEQA